MTGSEVSDRIFTPTRVADSADQFARPFFFVNDGTGNFTWDASWVEGIEGTGIFTAELVDVDRDGYVDLLAAGHEHEGFSTQILWGDDSGVFTTLRASTLTSVRGHGIVVDIDVADTDGDGDRDVVLNRTGDERGPGTYHGYYVQLLEQTAPRSFADRTQQQLQENENAEADWVIWLRVFDIDIFYAPTEESSRPMPAELYVNDGDGIFSLDAGFMDGNPPALAAAAKALPGDYNGDGRLDVFVTGLGRDLAGEPPYVILSSGDGFVIGRRPAGAAGLNFGGASADVDADGDLDVFLTHHQSLELNDGNGLFASSPEIGGVQIDGLDYFLITAELVDVDSDGYVDLLVGAHESDGDSTQILWADSTGLYSTSKRTILPAVAGHGAVLDIDVGDTDGDGDKDIVVSRTGDDTGIGWNNGYYVQLVENIGDRRFKRCHLGALLPGNRDDETLYSDRTDVGEGARAHMAAIADRGVPRSACRASPRRSRCRDHA